MPWLWFVSCVCEAFNCLPTQAAAEIDRLPAGVIEDILLMRAIADIRGQFRSGRKEADISGDPQLVAWVGDSIAAQEYEALQARKRAAGIA